MSVPSGVPLISITSYSSSSGHNVSFKSISFENVNGTVLNLPWPFTTMSTLDGLTFKAISGGSACKFALAVTVEKCVFESCSHSEGAAIYASAGVTIVSTKFILCSGTTNGGAVYLTANAKGVLILIFIFI
jgi:hypothetical protein